MFTWIPVYQQLAQQVLRYEHRQRDLIAILSELGITNLTDRDVEGKTIPLKEMDGLTFFRHLNRFGDDKRLQLLQALCTRWNITPLPTDVEGLPTVSSMKVALYPVKTARLANEIQRLWAFFKALVNDTVTDVAFQDVLRISGVGKVNLTEMMFMLSPDKYLCLNRPVKTLLETARLVTQFHTLPEYLTIIRIAREVFSKSFPALSREARNEKAGALPDAVAEEEPVYRLLPPALPASALNLILYGPPGTGKTYQAIDRAVALADAAFYREHRSDRPALTQRFEELLLQDYARPDGQIAFCTFHQSMSYEDFVEGIKPEMGKEDGQLRYQVQEGIFKAIARRAAKALKKKQPLNYVLIIDEINRGNVSAILGELITLLEANKRTGQAEALTVTLPYSKKPFSVPPNLYIIGTMNTADRSIEALDTALRRRFVLEEVLPQPELLAPPLLLNRLYHTHQSAAPDDELFRQAANSLYQLLGMDPAMEATLRNKTGQIDADKVLALPAASFEGVQLDKLLAAINQRLTVLLTPNHTIGHAWLMEVYSLADLRNVFKYQILPLLQEYFYNHYGRLGLVLGNGFVQQQAVSNHLFARFTNRQDIAGDYEGAVTYSLKNADELTIEDFKAVYA